MNEDKTIKKPTVSIVIPAYNEEKAIGEDIGKIKEAMKRTNYDYEIVVVDDGSTDRTAEIAKEKGARVIRHSENRGVGASRKTGIKEAKGEIIVMTDADGSYPNHQIPELLEFIPEYDQVVGARKEEKGTYRFLRSFAKLFIRKLAEFLSGKKIPDLNSGLRVFKKDIMSKYLYLIPDGFSCVSSMTLIFLTNGYRVKFVPIDYYKRVGESKFHPIKDTYNYLITVIRIITYFNPLKVFTTISIFLLAIGIIKSIYDFFSQGTLQESDIILIISAVIIISIGMLADLIVVHGRRE
jgi:glycosyltransferase involved in cell wall biosynthesis